MQVDLRLRYLNNNLKFTYLNISNEFENPGNPYLMKDVAGFYILDNIRFFKNQVFLNLFYKNYANNMIEDEFKTRNSEFGATLSYFPFRNLPSVTVGYENYNRDNGVSEQDTTLYSYLYMEDNITTRLSLASSYRLNINTIRNTISVNLSRYRRNDEADV